MRDYGTVTMERRLGRLGNSLKTYPYAYCLICKQFFQTYRTMKRDGLGGWYFYCPNCKNGGELVNCHWAIQGKKLTMLDYCDMCSQRFECFTS